MPSPLSRPALLRMSERDRCPNMIARIDNGNANRKSPQTKLAIAFPLVSAGAIAAGVITLGAETSLPQTLQNFSPADTLLPQLAQNTMCDLRGSRRDANTRRKYKINKLCRNLHRTLLLSLHHVNLLDGFSPVCLATLHSGKVRGNDLCDKN